MEFNFDTVRTFGRNVLSITLSSGLEKFEVRLGLAEEVWEDLAPEYGCLRHHRLTPMPLNRVSVSQRSWHTMLELQLRENSNGSTSGGGDGLSRLSRSASLKTSSRNQGPFSKGSSYR